VPQQVESIADPMQFHACCEIDHVFR
jgi:hypothetical protein